MWFLDGFILLALEVLPFWFIGIPLLCVNTLVLPPPVWPPPNISCTPSLLIVWVLPLNRYKKLLDISKIYYFPQILLIFYSFSSLIYYFRSHSPFLFLSLIFISIVIAIPFSFFLYFLLHPFLYSLSFHFNSCLFFVL